MTIPPICLQLLLTAGQHRRKTASMRLIDELAAKRLYYHRPLPTLPDILLIDIPPRFSGGGLALGRYYPVILESLSEMHEFEAHLCESRMTLEAPALLDRRPSGLRTTDIIFARYEPQVPNWPWLLICFWPRSYTAMVSPSADTFARGSYTIDAYSTAGELTDAELKLLATLGPEQARIVRSVATRLGNA
ncbi:hypothetical protein [Sphingopyxis indica]|uniref:hypothetical protein n=1 Tax=Sphingopyxis indica TaxID=436663 RepID=UPI0029393BBB|nr:hypothetical protein [Sphingopyxis indica]